MSQVGAAPDPAPATSNAKAPVVSAALLLLRLGLGGLFVYAAYSKLFALNGPLNFSEAVQAFKTIRDDRWVLLATFAIPWAELLCGLALILGLWTRAAALVLALLLALFIGLIVSLILRNGTEAAQIQAYAATLAPESAQRANLATRAHELLHVTCGCFRNFHLICKGTVEWCKVGENSGLLLIATAIHTWGSGRFGLDHGCRDQTC